MGRLAAALAFARQGLAARRAEALLLGLTFAVVFCTSASAVGVIRSGRREIAANIQRLGRDIVQIHKSLSIASFFREPLVRADIESCRAATGGLATGAKTFVGALAAGPGRDRSALVVQTDAAWPLVNESAFSEGRFFREGEPDACVLDVWLARELFDTAEAEGRQVSVTFGGTARTFTVAGVIADPLAIRARFQNLDSAKNARHPSLRLLESKNIYLPHGAVAPGDDLSLVLVKLPPGAGPQGAVAALKRAFGPRQAQLMFWARGPWIDNMLDALDVFRAFSNVVWMIFVLLAAGMVMTLSGLFISGRTAEIGIRRTQGASRAAVLAQILIEGLMLQGGGAAAGTALSPLAGAWICRHLPWKFGLGAQDIALVLGAGLLTSLAALLIPALRAVAREPMDVLRES